MSVEYYPASTHIPGHDSEYEGKHTPWFRKNPILDYNRVLFSYHYGGKIAPNYRKEKIGKHITSLMGDSGGFQAATLGMKFDPIDVIRWQNNFCDIGFTLDIPPLDGNPLLGKYLTGDKLTKCMETSNKNAEIMMMRKNKELDLYLVIQGNNNKVRQDWLDNGRKEFPDWDGYAISVKPVGDVKALINTLKFAVDNELKNIHILGMTGKITAGILVYFSKYFDSVKIDSSSYTCGSRFNGYILPQHIGKTVQISSRNSSLPQNLPCDCVICQFIKEHKLFENKNINHSLIAYLLDDHNLIQYNRFIDMLNWTCDYDPEFYPSLVPGLRKMIEYGENIIESNTEGLDDWI